MRPNPLKQRWNEGGAVLNAWLSLSNAFVAELMAHQGFDSLTIDMQHGMMDYQMAVNMLTAISTTNVAPVVRVPWNEPSLIMRMADAGAYGIICPLVNSRQECEAFVGACRYPPEGYRSYGPIRARIYAGNDYVENANQTLVTIAMIETTQALDALDEIASTPGLDALYIGPADLSLSLGRTQRSDYTDPFLIEKLEQVVAAARRHNIAAGLHCATPEYAARAVQMGFRFVTPVNDTALIEQGARKAIQIFSNATGPVQAGNQETQETKAQGSRTQNPY